MDQLIQKIISKANNEIMNTHIIETKRLNGGYSQETRKVKLSNGKDYFIKISSKKDFPKLRFEAEGLSNLRKFNNSDFLEIPQPLALEQIGGYSLLIIPWLSIKSGDECKLGKGLALLHKASNSKNSKLFGWESNGFIGLGPQPRGSCKSWGECFVSLRLMPQLKIAAKWGLQKKEYESLLPGLIKYLDNHKPSPCLVHGDLWSGNKGVLEGDKGVIFDPAIWWADREVDIAMTMLFGKFKNSFYEGYEKIWPLSKSFKDRKDIYNLYHLLNHANIFNSCYKEQSVQVLKQITDIIN